MGRTAIRERTAAEPRGKGLLASRGFRRTVIAAHVIFSVGWLGVTIGDLTLGVTALVTDRPELQHAVFRVLVVLGELVLIPLSLLAFLSGVALSLITKWGLVRYWWVLAKLVLTTIALVLIPFSLVPGYAAYSAVVDATPPDQLADIGSSGVSALLGSGCVSLTMYTTCTVLSIFKPWGRVRRTH